MNLENILKSLGILLLLFVVACNEGQKDSSDDNTVIVNDDWTVSEDAKKVSQIFYNVPSPIEMASIMQQAGALYNADILNPIENADKYLSNSDKALNLGVYGANLSYTRIFDQIQESMNYLSAIKKLSDGLGIPRAEGSQTINKLEENLDDRDSLLYVISETYSNADLYLKENDRGSTAAKIIFGGWIEALYISTKIIDKNNPSKEIMHRIAEQKYSLENLIELMNIYKEKEDMSFFVNNLDSLKVIFDKVQITHSDNEVDTDKEKKLTTINCSSEININIEIIKEIESVVDKIRAEIVN